MVERDGFELAVPLIRWKRRDDAVFHSQWRFRPRSDSRLRHGGDGLVSSRNPDLFSGGHRNWLGSATSRTTSGTGGSNPSRSPSQSLICRILLVHLQKRADHPKQWRVIRTSHGNGAAIEKAIQDYRLIASDRESECCSARRINGKIPSQDRSGASTLHRSTVCEAI